MNWNKYYPKSYKEKEISTPHESGRKELSTKDKDSLSETWKAHKTDDETIEFTSKNEINWAFEESAYDAEQEIYDTIDYNLWNTENISPALVEALEYYEKSNSLYQKHKNQLKNRNPLYNSWSLKILFFICFSGLFISLYTVIVIKVLIRKIIKK
jgi:hypothetical protein